MDEQVMRVPPNNADAEKSVLGCMMQDREALSLAFELLTAEDFSFFGKERPAVYAFVGAGDEKRSAPLHSDQFDFDEAALLPAIAWYTRIIDACAKEE